MELNESILPVLAIGYIVAFVIFADRNNKSTGLQKKIRSIKKENWLF